MTKTPWRLNFKKGKGENWTKYNERNRNTKVCIRNVWSVSGFWERQTLKVEMQNLIWLGRSVILDESKLEKEEASKKHLRKTRKKVAEWKIGFWWRKCRHPFCHIYCGTGLAKRWRKDIFCGSFFVRNWYPSMDSVPDDSRRFVMDQVSTFQNCILIDPNDEGKPISMQKWSPGPYFFDIFQNHFWAKKQQFSMFSASREFWPFFSEYWWQKFGKDENFEIDRP